jgi:hypothetical protein
VSSTASPLPASFNPSRPLLAAAWKRAGDEAVQLSDVLIVLIVAQWTIVLAIDFLISFSYTLAHDDRARHEPP